VELVGVGEGVDDPLRVAHVVVLPDRVVAEYTRPRPGAIASCGASAARGAQALLAVADGGYDDRMFTSVLGVGAIIVSVLGVVSYHASWRCHRAPERAGWRLDPRVGFAALVVLCGAIPLLMAWIHEAAAEGWSGVLKRAGVSTVCLLLHFPFVSYHVGDYFARKASGEDLDDGVPDDDFARARALEDRGDARGAIEQYSIMVKRSPLRTDARLRLAALLAGARRGAQAKDVLRTGLTLDELPDSDRDAIIRALGELDGPGYNPAAPSGEGRVARDVRTTRMEAHEQDKASRANDDPALPLE